MFYLLYQLLSDPFLSSKVDDMEWYFVLFVFIVSIVIPRLASSQFAPLERTFAQFARRRTLAWVAVGILALIVRAAALPLLHVPVPAIHDEYENLLMADTFSHGRLTNPPHPMSIHFETFHVIQEPTYMGIVPPAQAMALAAGKLLGGHPFVGVWLSVGIMCAAICWMLQGWLPPSWALLGGILAVMRFGILSYWANSYWGGAVAATGGALLLGAFPRIRKYHRITDVLLMGIGLAILANSRQYEGFVLSLPVAGGLLVWLTRSASSRWRMLAGRVVLPFAMMLIVTGGAMGYYNWRVTGNPLRSPYSISNETVNPVPYFPWQALRPIPEYRYPIFRDLYVGWDLPQYEELQTFHGWISLTGLKLKRIWKFYLGPALVFPIILAILTGGFRAVFLGRLRFLFLCFGVTLAGLLLEVQYSPHYAAPLTAIFLAFIVQAIRWVYITSRRGKSRLLFAARAVPILCLISIFLAMAQISQGHIMVTGWPHSWYSLNIGNTKRVEVLNWLEQQPGQQLIIVRYSPKHSVHDEWVYNLSDIDGAKVIWARDMDEEHNQELIRYFRNRHIWIVEPDDRLHSKLQIIPYPDSSPIPLPATGQPNPSLR
jgi:hypothetical protein